MSSILENYSPYLWISTQDALDEYPEISMPHIASEPSFDTAHAPEEVVIRSCVDISSLAEEILATLLNRGFVRPPSIPTLMEMILSRGSFRSHEIREIILRMYPTEYKDKKAYQRLVENVKHNLTRCKCFEQTPRIRGMAGKGGLWRYVSSAKPKAKRSAPRPRIRGPAIPTTTIPSPAPTDTTEITDEIFMEASSLALSPIADSVDACWIPPSSAEEDALLSRSGSVPETSSTSGAMPLRLFSQGAPGVMMANTEVSRHWMLFPTPHGYEFGTTPQPVQSMSSMTSGTPFIAVTGSHPNHRYAALPYGSAQFTS
ncbi:hypothetical protein M407DRAFT_32971 [Tulasnella calospora MUT 4182]|uniref:Fork-head domain-containing protein n=1 Tax=Tulasnella calospora MUT 4182 TaxID=1051891 RepID=A0A0C3PRU2_9AGAM|nr:hypothetical protein M407DRAFT_32971 [Tulasnella calospora MUT 4182]